jgi:hypothetical protein
MNVAGVYVSDGHGKVTVTQNGAHASWVDPTGIPVSCTISGNSMDCSWPSHCLKQACPGGHKDPTGWTKFTREPNGNFVGNWGYGKDREGASHLTK